ncbi:lisH domain-containing protein ARMC9 isoform X7 [Spodoptera frugiperda]|uniref:LisH domain-containing protein ARMC9 isoform X7 n=1 Tax=Spodoptera frugiperda TaxID=7108 RepID=A0A9R0EJP2_SPOFR|nr:lisH domain-containing protein ARMC9 isoform X7 [Spodoptera frugiperda]
MVRWRYCIALAMLLLLPAKTEDFDEDRNEEGEEEDEDDEDDEEDESAAAADKGERVTVVRRPPPIVPTPKALTVTRTIKKRPLECYVCAYKAETPLRACLDPTKYRVHTITCHSVDDKCFTSVISKGNSYEAVVRGCRSGCVGSPETTCCELNRCNNQAFAMPVIAPRTLTAANGKAGKTIPPTILFFVTVLLVLQTVVKVAFV